MKTKLWFVIGLMLITLAATVAPVMGVPVVGADTTAVISANMASQVSISTVGEITNWILVAGDAPNVNNAAQLSISGNGPFTISAKDWMPGPKPAGTDGRMAEVVLDTGTWPATAAGGKSLLTPLAIDSTATNFIIATSLVALTANPQTIYSSDGAHGYSNQLLPLTFKQMVGLSEPRVSAAGNAFRIPVVFTITATA